MCVCACFCVYLLGTVPDGVHVVVVGLQQGLSLLLDLQGALVGLLYNGMEPRYRVTVLVLECFVRLEHASSGCCSKASQG